LVHVIVPPTATAIGFGEYAVVVKVDEPATIDTGVPVTPFDGADGELDPQPTVKPITPAMMLKRIFMCSPFASAIASALPAWRRTDCHDLLGKCRFPLLSLFPKVRRPFSRRNVAGTLWRDAGVGRARRREQSR
jgi:hypothetical protein